MAIGVGAFVAVAAVNAIAQAYMANKQMGADKQRLNQIKAEYDAIKPPEIDTDIETYIAEHPELKIDTGTMPSFENLRPEEYKVLQKYAPETFAFVQQQDPELVKRGASGEEGLAAQRQALRKLMMTGSLEQDPELMQAIGEAQKRGQIGAQSRQQSLLQDFARRGQSGSGVQLAAQMGAGEDQMSRSAMQSQEAATQAYKNRLAQLMQGADLGGRMEQTDINLQGRNADIINQFNQMTSKQYQDYLAARAGQANEAQKYNIAQNQSVANMNVGNQNQYKQQMADLSKWGYQQNIANKQQDFNNALSAMQAGNQAKMGQYDVATSKAKTMAGLPSINPMQYYAPIVQKAADVGTQFASQQMSRDAANTAEDREDARLEYEQTGKWRES